MLEYVFYWMVRYSAAILLALFASETLAETIPATLLWSGYSTPQARFDALFAAWDTANPNNTVCYRSGYTMTNNGTSATHSYKTLQGGSCSSSLTTLTINAVVSCPANQGWTLEGTTCTRTAQCGPDSTKTKGSPATSSGYFDMGTDMDGKTFPRVVCASGCLASFSGTAPATSSIVNGIKRYFAKGGYFYIGNSADTCTAAGGDPAPGSPVSEKPQDSCRPDQIAGIINGKMNCWNTPESQGQPSTQAQTEAPIEQTTTTNKQTTTNPDNSTTTTETTTKPDGSTVVTSTTCQGGNCSTTQTETKPAESEEFAMPMAGNFSEVGDLVQADERTFGTVWASRRAELNASPLFGIVTSLTSFNATAAVCPSFNLQGQIFGKSIGGDLSPPCWLWGVLKAILILTSLFVARRMIFGG